MKAYDSIASKAGSHAIDIADLNLEQLGEETDWFIIIDKPDAVRDVLEMSFCDEMDSIGDHLVPFAVIDVEGEKLRTCQPHTMLFFDLKQGDVEDPPIRVCYSDQWDAALACDSLSGLLAAIK